MTGHLRKRGNMWTFVVDLDGQRAQRCTDCDRRLWLQSERAAETCRSCGGQLGVPHAERRQVWRSGFSTKKAAGTAMREYLARIDAGKDPFPSDISVRDWVDRWLESERVRSLRSHTIARYKQVLDDYLLPQLGGIKVSDVRPRHIRPVLDAMSSKGLSARSVNEAKNILSTVFRAALEDEVIETNPAAAVRAKAHRRRPLATPTTEELGKLVRATKGSVWEMPIALAAYLGMRRSEVLGLRWSDINLDKRTLRVQRGLQRTRVKGAKSRLEFFDVKTENSRRQLELGVRLVARLKRHSKAQAERRLLLGAAWVDEDLVCDRGDGGPLDPDAMSRATKRFVVRAGLPAGVRLHDVRHGVATAMLASGVDTKIASAVLGHSSAAFTADQYQHVLKGMTKSATNAIDKALGS